MTGLDGALPSHPPRPSRPPRHPRPTRPPVRTLVQIRTPVQVRRCSGLVCVETRGWKAVGFKADERGRTVDVHALRHTFGTQLSKAGVPWWTAQAAVPDLRRGGVREYRVVFGCEEDPGLDRCPRCGRRDVAPVAAARSNPSRRRSGRHDVPDCHRLMRFFEPSRPLSASVPIDSTTPWPGAQLCERRPVHPSNWARSPVLWRTGTGSATGKRAIARTDRGA